MQTILQTQSKAILNETIEFVLDIDRKIECRSVNPVPSFAMAVAL